MAPLGVEPFACPCYQPSGNQQGQTSLPVGDSNRESAWSLGRPRCLTTPGGMSRCETTAKFQYSTESVLISRGTYFTGLTKNRDGYETRPMTTRAEAMKMSRKEVRKLIIDSGALPGSLRWETLGPVYEERTRRGETARFWIGFAVSTTMGIVALIVSVMK